MIEIGETSTEIDTTSEPEVHSTPNCLEKIDSHDLSYEQFHQNYMNRNVALLITSIPLQWKSMQNWTKPTDESNATVDFQCLRHEIPDQKVPIADCTKKDLNSHKKFEMNFYDFLDYWEKRMKTGPDRESVSELLYLKDWHLRRNLPMYDFYAIPKYFGSDWLNEYLTHRSGQDDYKFVYMGPKGTWTPFHADVFSSFSWSTNIFGTKKWLLLYPNEEKKLLDHLSNLPFHITEEMLQQKHCAYVCLIQNAGDTIFVPSGWHHQVHNIDHTISINHNFFNGCNLSHVWSALLGTYERVKKEIEDCRDMDNFEGHCQIMLKALHGMNFGDFLDILNVIADNRIKCLTTGEQMVINEAVMGRNLCLFDLKSCRSVLEAMERSCHELALGTETLDACNRLKTRINEVLKNYMNFKNFFCLVR